MLKKLVEVDHKCFRQFKWGELPELARFNLFYGWNGTGKTTLSNLLADLGRNVPIRTGKVVFRIDKLNIQGDHIGQDGLPLPLVRVFNQRTSRAVSLADSTTLSISSSSVRRPLSMNNNDLLRNKNWASCVTIGSGFHRRRPRR